jgi:predicted regulator of Ras-like GTPase activity (Roadblock/LC7/MglB family)
VANLSNVKPIGPGGAKAILQSLVAVEGIRTAVVVSRDGFVIDEASAKGAVDAEAIGAVISTGVGSGFAMGHELELGELTQGMFEYQGGFIIMSLASPEAILAVVTEPTANLGNARYQVKKRMPELAKAL